MRRLMVAGLVLALTGCGTGLIPGDPAIPAGARQWIITVENESAAPAVLMVAEDTMPIGEQVGSAEPARVPPNTTVDVTFIVPPGQTWAIFVNPSPRRGPLILAMDVPPDATGRLPVSINIDAAGNPSASLGAGAGEGWFGE